MVHRILLEKMGVENYAPKFLKVVQPAGLNKETNQKGKRYLFLYAASNSLMKVEKVKAIVQSLHASEYVNSNGQPKKCLGIHLPSHLNSKVRDNTALLREINQHAKERTWLVTWPVTYSQVWSHDLIAVRDAKPLRYHAYQSEVAVVF